MNITLLGAYTPAALKGLMSGSDRKAAVESALAAVGGTLEHLAFTRGGYDVVVRATVPDSTSLVGLVVAIKARAHSRKQIISKKSISQRFLMWLIKLLTRLPPDGSLRRRF